MLGWFALAIPTLAFAGALLAIAEVTS